MTTTAMTAMLENKPRGLWADARRRMFRSPLTLLGFAIVLVMLAFTVAPSLFAPYDPYKGDLRNWYVKPPVAAHPFGTDDIGRDVLSRVIHGAQISLRVAVIAEALGVAIGVVLGLITGYYGGWIDSLIMRFVDVFMAFPLLIIAIALIAALGPGEVNLFIALALVIWPFVTRLVRAQVLSLRESEYVNAARLLGASDLRIMFAHILPNILTPLIVFATLGIANTILQEAALRFLGLGNVDRSTPSWGSMLNDARSYLESAPWMALYPSLAIMLTVIGFNLLGDGLRDALDVRSQ